MALTIDKVISAGTTVASLGDVVFSNSNGVSFGADGQTITAQHNGLTSQSNQAFSAQGGSSAFQTLIFTNSNGFSFSNTGGSIWGSYTVPSTAGLISNINVSAGSTSNNLSAITFSNSNGVSFGLDGSTITASVAAAGGSMNISAGTTSNNLTDLIFSNSNGVSFGLDGSTVTAQHNGLTSQSNQAFSAEGGSSAFQTLNFVNTNGVSFSNSNGSVYATVVTNYQSAGAYLTTAMQSNAATISNIKISAGTLSTNRSDISFNNSNGVSFGLETNGIITATVQTNYLTSQSNQAFSADASSTFQTLSLQNSNGISFSNNAGAIRLTHDLQFTSATSAITSNALNTSVSRVINILAAANNTGGGTASLSSNISFSNANGATFYTSAGNVIALSYTIPTVTNSSFSVQDSATTINPVSRIAFSTGNNITATLSTAANHATVGFSHNLAGISTGFGGNLLSASMTHNSSGLNLSLNHPAWLTTAALSGDTTKYVQNWKLTGNTAGTTSSAQGTDLWFSAGNSITVSGSSNSIVFSVGNYITTAMLSNAATISNIKVSAGTSSTNLSAITFDNAGGISFGLNGSVITAVAPAGAPSPVNFSAGTTSGNLASVVFSNSNNATFGLNGSTITVSSPISISAGTTNENFTNMVFSNSNGVSFGLNGSTITASVAAYTALSLQNRQLGASTTLNSNGGQNSLWLVPVRVAAPVSASTILAAMISYSGTITSAATAQAGQTLRVGIWSQHTDPASTSRFDTWWTGAASLTFWNSGTSSVSYNYSQSGGNTTSSSAGSNLLTASAMGVRHIILPINSTMTTGLYVFGVLNSSSSAGYSAAMSRMALYMDNPMSVGAGTFGQATNNSIGYVGGGTYLTTTGALPNTLALNQIGQVANVMPYFKVGAI